MGRVEDLGKKMKAVSRIECETRQNDGDIQYGIPRKRGRAK